jgi:hypothetical protein
MNKILVVVAGLLLFTCVSATAGYRTEVTVKPDTDAHLYLVQFKIMDVGNDGKTKVLATPLIAVPVGEEGTVRLSKENEESGLFCTALVNETEDGVEAITTVVVKENGSEKLSNAQSITVAK